jgi:hypothetical protein
MNCYTYHLANHFILQYKANQKLVYINYDNTITTTTSGMWNVDNSLMHAEIL